jgi:hypothetical protein
LRNAAIVQDLNQHRRETALVPMTQSPGRERL